MPRAISPSASDGTLPCSAVRNAASSLRWVSTRLRTRNITSVRLESDVARQPGKAAFAAATAASTSADRREVHLARDLAGGRVVDGTPPAGRAGNPSPADPVGDASGRGDDERELTGSATWVIDEPRVGRAG